MADTTVELTIVPANEASWEDLQAVFGTRGDPSRCRCQRYKMQPSTAYPRLLRSTRVPWAGRAEDKTDDVVWAVTCFLIRTGFRRQEIS